MITKCTRCEASLHNHAPQAPHAPHAPQSAAKAAGGNSISDPAKVFGGTTVAEYEAQKMASTKGCSCGGNCTCKAPKNLGDPADPYGQQKSACGCGKR